MNDATMTPPLVYHRDEAGARFAQLLEVLHGADRAELEALAEAGARFAQILEILYGADRAELQALAADAQCVYRTEAALVLELLERFDQSHP